MQHLSKAEIHKIAAALLAKHATLGAGLTVTTKGGGVNMGKMQATLSASEKTETGLGASGDPLKGGGGNGNASP